MSAVRLFLDADAMQEAVIVGLRARGVDVTTSAEAGIAGRPDEEQLEMATSQSRVLFSYNVAHFCRIHREYVSHAKSHAGIIVAPQQRYSVGERIRSLLRLLAAKSAEEMRDRLEYLSNRTEDRS